ncbi:MAG: DUF1311 domain-containing protein [Moraxellaceae bacterium]|nr:DUF1311 domain-containing protein [Moraxellaceae bacterium]
MKKLFFTILLCMPILGHSVSFDCNKATTWVEKSICKNKQLSKLDDKMVAIYKKKLATAHKEYADRIRKEQRRWLKYRRNTCKTVTCLKREYRENIKGLQSKSLQTSSAVTKNNPKPTADKFGKFEDEVEIFVYQGKKRGWGKDKASQLLTLDKIHHKNKLALLNIALVLNNAHTCSVEDEVVYWSENHWKMRDSTEYYDCELRVYPAKNKVLLQDINNGCQGFCGLSAYFDGIILKKTD